MCPQFGIDNARIRPDNDVANQSHSAPRLAQLGGESMVYGVVWWDPIALELGKAPSFSIRQRELLEKVNDEFVQKSLLDYGVEKCSVSAAERGHYTNDSVSDCHRAIEI